MEQRHERQAINEGLFREANEARAAIDRRAAEAWAAHDAQFEFVCECGAAGGCGGRMLMTLAEYDHVREQDDRFALVVGHETDALERVVHRTERFVVVDKLPAAERFTRDDPRGAPSR